MAKSIRSKSKRKNRTEFRNTIGSEAAKANMATIQSKLQECISCGQMNSFDRLSNLFSGGSNNTNQVDNGTTQINEEDDGDIDMGGTKTFSSGGKDSSKIPTKKSVSKKHTMQKMNGQYGDQQTRKVSERRQRQGKRGRDRVAGGSRLRSSSKKRSGKKLATI